MDKKSILAIVIMGLIFLGFAFYTNIQQAEYQEKMQEWEAQQDSIAAASRPVVEADQQVETVIEEELTAEEKAQAKHDQMVLREGEYLTHAKELAAEEFEVENDVMKVRFSTKGGRIVGVQLKNYTKYAPKGERNEQIELFDPKSVNFNLDFRAGLHNLPLALNTQDYTFEADPVEKTAEGNFLVKMRLCFSQTEAIEYNYVIHNSQNESENVAAAENYLVDFDVKMLNMEQLMLGQTQLAINWSNVSYQNERGFKNENMYTTIAYRLPDESSIEDLSMSEETSSKNENQAVNWVAFKQQYFSSVFIAKDHFAYANMKFETEAQNEHFKSPFLKHFSTEVAVPYRADKKTYDFAFYFGPNEYPILKHVGDEEVYGDLYLERLVPLGWGIFGWVNRWCVIPVFDFLRNYISSFGVIIFLLVLLVKLVISPLTYKSYVSMAKMRLIKPQVDELNKKYPKQEDAMKRQQETMQLYKKAGINPMGGCIPMLIQLPILYAMFRFFPASIELRGQSFLWADDLSSYDSVLNLPFSIPFYGDHVSLFALLMAVSLFGYSYYNYQQTASSQPQMGGMKFMMVYMMPIMMLLWFNSYSSGLCYYYLLSNLFTIGQTLVIRRMVDDTKILRIMEANAARKSNGKKSKFQMRYEQLMREQEARQKGKK